MDLNEDVVRRLAADMIVGDAPPYSWADPESVDRHLKELVAALQRSDLIGLEADFDHYGSGYSSYVHAFAWLSDRSGHVERRDGTDIAGLHLYLCRRGPFAAWGPGSKSRNKDGSGAGGFLEWEEVGVLPAGRWKEAIAEIERKLRECGLRTVTKMEVETPLPGDIKVASLFDPPYRVFDAVFHWID